MALSYVSVCSGSEREMTRSSLACSESSGSVRLGAFVLGGAMIVAC